MVLTVRLDFPFPQEPFIQLMEAIGAVFRSWDSPRAIEYRRLHDIRDLIGTAAIIQVMVFGNMGATSGSGVGFPLGIQPRAKILCS